MNNNIICRESNSSCISDYIKHDIEITRSFYNDILSGCGYRPRESSSIPEIKNVIFNKSATIVFWSDETKTVVKAYDEPFDPEKGLAMAISKKALGNTGNYYNKIKKWI